MTTAVASYEKKGLRNRVAFLVELFSDTFERFSDNEGFRLGAAFSYYATFSIFPLLLLSITIVGFLVGDSAATRDELLDAIAAPGNPVRDVVAKTLTAMQESGSARGISAVVGVVTLFFGASGAFTEVDAALNRIWCVADRKAEGLKGTVRVFVQERLASFAIVAGLGLTVLVSLVASSVLSFITAQTNDVLGGGGPLWPAIMKTTESATSIVLLTFVFTLAFHFIPRTRPPMRLVLPGALLTTVFLSALKEVFATYLAHITNYSAYGVAGGVLGLATWIYLTSMIIFLGAQLTRIYAEKIGAVEPCALQRGLAPSRDRRES
ncbi:MAG: YihY/virulence factor BrkB family protein [Labilithrix sp.]|nr:YihY/virulence factor BrkB family protein [Labilithrix sp.]MCW5809814.1 YihY/virulence factor BrkB family protein [Labilithrix sp.]